MRIIQGDCREVLKTLPAESVDCVVTSQPYWGLRDYGVAGQMGLEGSLGEHLDVMVDVFREVRRVLKKTGTVWLNYGDAYACAPNGRSAAATKALGNDDRTFRDKPISTVGAVYQTDHRPNGTNRTRGVGSKQTPGAETNTPQGRVVAGGYLKPKDRMLLPARLAIALQEDGWWVRDEIIWAKPNPMPSSVKDRTTPAHEMIYMLSKAERYFYDHAAIKEPLAAASIERLAQDIANQAGSLRAHAGKRGDDRPMKALGGGDSRAKRSVWTVPPKGFKEAHFATFPPHLIRPCILAGCPVGGVVLDPFFGAGTVGMVAEGLGREAIGIELNADYIKIAERRLRSLEAWLV